MAFNFNNATTTNYGHALPKRSSQQLLLKSFASQVHGQIAPTNFLIRVQEYQFKVHNSAIMPKSSFFSTMASSRFKEATDNVVTLQEDDPRLIARLIWFCYSSKGCYPLGLDSKDDADEVTLRELLTAGYTSTEGTPAPLHDLYPDFAAGLHLAMYVLADKYGMPTLEDRSLAALDSMMQADGTVFWRLVKSLDDAPERVEARLVPVLIRHAAASNLGGEACRDARFKHLIYTRPDMAWQILKAGRPVRRGGPYHRHKLPECTALRTSNDFGEEGIRQQLGGYAYWAQSITEIPGSSAFQIEFGDGDIAEAALEETTKDPGFPQFQKGYKRTRFDWVSPPYSQLGRWKGYTTYRRDRRTLGLSAFAADEYNICS